MARTKVEEKPRRGRPPKAEAKSEKPRKGPKPAKKAAKRKA